MVLPVHFDMALQHALSSLVQPGQANGGSPLAQALTYSVFPAGARLRPRLAFAVAAIGKAEQAALPAAVAIELLHSASLVHDDLPAFDDAMTRRGKPSTHRAFGVPLALLTGDALLALSFRVLAPLSCQASREAVAKAACALIEGQALELVSGVPLRRYHAQKTAGLFAVAAEVGALAAGLPTAPYVALGEAIGHAYQLADDLYDVGVTAANDSKERGNDARHGQPNAAQQAGREVAYQELEAQLHHLRTQASMLSGATSTLTMFVDRLTEQFFGLAAATPILQAGA